MVKLFCVLVGKERSAFSLTIDALQSVEDLKYAIKVAKPDLRCDVREMKLYLAKKGDTWLTEKEAKNMSDFSGLKHLGAIQAKLHRIGLSDAQVVKEVDGNERAAGNGPVNVLVVEFGESITPSRKRVRSLPDDLEAHDLEAPTSFAKRHVWSSFFVRDSRIICDRVDRPKDVPPLTLLNPIFNEFVGGCCGKIEITDEDVIFATDFAKAMQQYFPFEAQRAKELLSSYLDIPILCLVDEKCQNYGSISSTKRSLLCMNLDVKVERGKGDIGMRSIGFYIHQTAFKQYSEKYEIPALLVELEGPWLGVSAVLNINGSIIHETLSPQLPFGASNHLAQTAILCLASLKRAVLALFHFYNQDELSKIPATCLPFGCTRKYVNIKRNVYSNSLGKIVKFVEGRYGDTVHRFCAARGNAPPLLSCELVSPNCIWWRVEMEEWKLKSITEAINPDDAQSQLKLLLDELRANNFVHGDLRPPNVFLHGSQEKVVLVDFDWAGVAGVDVYPHGMNPDIDWPEGAYGGAKLDPAHDLKFFHRMFSPEL